MLSVKLFVLNAMISNLNALLEPDSAPAFPDLYIDMLSRLLRIRHTLLIR